MAQPLEGIRVLELGNYIAGPVCGMLLGDMGADVIKIEPPHIGDHTRMFPPVVNGESACFANLNRNKRSIILDLKRPEDREIMLKLVETADVLVENNRPGALEKLGLGAKDLLAVKPDLVYVSASGFGQTGPYRRRGGVNFTVEAYAGSLSICGEPDQMPMRTGIQTADIVAALFSTYSALIGIINVLRNRKGHSFDVSLSESTIAVAVWETAEYLATGQVPQRLGHRHRVHTPAQLFETRGGRYIALSAATDEHFRRLMEVLGLQDRVADPRFSTKVQRKANEDALLEVLNPAILGWDVTELAAALDGVGIPCSPVNDYGQVFEDAQVKARGLVVDVEHPTMGTTRTVRNPVLMDSDGPEIRRPAPLHGEHTAEILRELGFEADHLAAEPPARVAAH
ncbi:CaiB/BaiF CoA transferase family protein [Faunimonas sp. B44]|uniref:CaiB/BaiF CoA transferase family protein n=1 Tax=Faunimonas sp. B44 TaxID=3461493 RepID=UPI0040445690